MENTKSIENYWGGRFKVSFDIICKLGVVVHTTLMFYFWLLDVYEMAIYNAVSTLFFFLMIYLIKKEYNAKVVVFATSIEVVLHCYLATYFIGADCGFILFAFVLPPVFLLNPKWSRRSVYLFYLAIILSFCVNSFLFRYSTARYPQSEALVFYTNVGIVISVFLMVFVVVFYYDKQVGDREEELNHANEELRLKNEEKNLIIKEIHHRIKNNLQVVISLLRLQASKINDHEVLEMFKDTQQRIFSMALLHENLLQEYALELINAREHFKFLSENLVNSYAVGKEIEVELDVDDIELAMQTLTPLGLIINEIITNSLKHAFEDVKKGKIGISLKSAGVKTYELQISDDGSGYTPKENTGSLGTRLVSIFVKQLNGTLELKTNNGTNYKIIFEEIEHT